MSLGDEPDTIEGWMRSQNKRSALHGRQGNPFPRLTALDADVEQRGVANSSGTAGSSSAPVFWDGGTTIVFPTPFSAPPIVTADVLSSSGVNWATPVTVTATQLVVRLHRINTAPVAGMLIHWTARPAVAP